MIDHHRHVVCGSLLTDHAETHFQTFSFRDVECPMAIVKESNAFANCASESNFLGWFSISPYFKQVTFLWNREIVFSVFYTRKKHGIILKAFLQIIVTESERKISFSHLDIGKYQLNTEFHYILFKNRSDLSLQPDSLVTVNWIHFNLININKYGFLPCSH